MATSRGLLLLSRSAASGLSQYQRKTTPTTAQQVERLLLLRDHRTLTGSAADVAAWATMQK